MKEDYTSAVNLIIKSPDYNFIGSVPDKVKLLMIKMVRSYSLRLLQKESDNFNTTDYSIYEDFIKNTLLDFASYILIKGISNEDYNHCIKSYYQTRRNKSYQTKYAVSVSNSKRGKSLEYCIDQYLNSPGTSSKHKNALRRLKNLLSTDLNGVKRYIDSLNLGDNKNEIKSDH